MGSIRTDDAGRKSSVKKEQEASRPVRAAIYARVSTPQQATEDKDSLPSQVRDLKAVAEGNGWEIRVFEEPGVSGELVDGRPALMRLLAEVEAGRVDVVMVRALDRLSRDYVANARVLAALRKGNVKLWAGGALQDMADVQGELITHILGVIGAGDKRALVQRMQRGRRAAVAKGKLSVGRPPYGYRYDKANRTLEILPEQAEVVRLIFRLYTEERLGALQIVRRLVALGVPVPCDGRKGKPKVRREGPEVNAKGKVKDGWFVRRLWGKEFWCKRGWRPSGEWRISTIIDILRNPVYKGCFNTYRAKGSRAGEFTIPVPAIVDDGTWDKTQKQIATNRRARGVKSPRLEYLLLGRIWCKGKSAQCGRKWRCKTRGRYGYYNCTCKDNEKRVYDPCDTKNVRADAFDALVWARVCDALRHSTLLTDALKERQAAAMVDSAALEGDLRRVQAALAGKAKERERVISMARRGIITEGEADREFAEIERERADLQQETQLLRRRILDTSFENERATLWRRYAQEVLPALDHLSFQERRELLNALSVKV